MCFVLYFFVLFGFLSLCSFYVYMTYCTYVHHLESEGCALYSIHILARQINLTIQYFYNIYKKSFELLFLLHSVPFLFFSTFLFCIVGVGWEEDIDSRLVRKHDSALNRKSDLSLVKTFLQ